jgi:adenylate cyclase
VSQEKKTFWEVPGPSHAVASLLQVDAIVAAPILDRNGAVIGALYGDRRQASASTSTVPITELDAMLVELLARGVAAGLARLEQEQEAMAARVRFEQFFSPELSRQLTLQPDLLNGRDEEVSILCCDIRGFSRICEKLGPGRTIEWINHALEEFSDCVRGQGRGCWWITWATS